MKIVQISAVQSQTGNQQNPITTVFGLGDDRKIYAWDWDSSKWLPYGKSE